MLRQRKEDKELPDPSFDWGHVSTYPQLMYRILFCIKRGLYGFQIVEKYDDYKNLQAFKNI